TFAKAFKLSKLKSDSAERNRIRQQRDQPQPAPTAGSSMQRATIGILLKEGDQLIDGNLVFIRLPQTKEGQCG
ncbi:MAG: hypothetical protein V3T83_00245, partial [Acidobacteriota bacterium]